MHVLLESLFELEVADLITPSIVVQQSVETYTLYAGHKTAGWSEGLQTATGANAHHRQYAMLVFLRASLIVDVGKCVEFVGHDVDVVTSDTMTLTSDALAFIGASDGMELTALHLALFRIEVCCHSVDAFRITHKDNLVGQLLWLQMQMEARTIGIDNKFGFWKMFLGHRLWYFS